VEINSAAVVDGERVAGGPEAAVYARLRRRGVKSDGGCCGVDAAGRIAAAVTHTDVCLIDFPRGRETRKTIYLVVRAASRRRRSVALGSRCSAARSVDSGADDGNRRFASLGAPNKRRVADGRRGGRQTESTTVEMAVCRCLSLSEGQWRFIGFLSRNSAAFVRMERWQSVARDG
jgi:hypothetical protein